jgi:hypothetical protein
VREMLDGLRILKLKIMIYTEPTIIQLQLRLLPRHLLHLHHVQLDHARFILLPTRTLAQSHPPHRDPPPLILSSQEKRTDSQEC